jgi:hypothetical protein
MDERLIYLYVMRPVARKEFTVLPLGTTLNHMRVEGHIIGKHGVRHDVLRDLACITPDETNGSIGFVRRKFESGTLPRWTARQGVDPPDQLLCGIERWFLSISELW